MDVVPVPMSMFDVDPNSSASRVTDSVNNKMSMLKEDIMGKHTLHKDASALELFTSWLLEDREKW